MPTLPNIALERLPTKFINDKTQNCPIYQDMLIDKTVKEVKLKYCPNCNNWFLNLYSLAFGLDSMKITKEQGALLICQK